jgi:hypothetical protein
MPTDQGIPIFGGFATVGGVVEVMIDARGIKCLGKPSIGNVGVVMGIDSSAPNGETLSIKCGRDMKTNTKVTNWYKPTDVKIYTPIDMAGTELDRLEAQLVMKRSELVKKQQEKPISAQQKADKITSMNMITLSITDLEKKIAALKTKGTTLEGMRDLYNRLSEDLAKFRKITATLDEEYNLARLDTSCNDSDVNTETALRRESEQLVDRYFEAIDAPTVQAIVDDPTYIKDVPSSDPEILRTLERDADQAVEVAAKEDATEVQKAAADDALTRLTNFKKQRQFQGPKTDLQQEYIRKRNVLIAALRGLNPALRRRTDTFALIDDTIPGVEQLNALGTPTEKYKAYLDLKLAVETAMRTNPADPIQFVTDSGNAAAAAINLIIDADSADNAINASGANVPLVGAAAATPLQQAGIALRNKVNDPNVDDYEIKIAAYNVLVAAVESQPTTIDDLYIDKLTYENIYKNFARSAYSSDLTRSYDTQDVMLRNVNRARNIFDEFIQANPADPRNVAFKAVVNAFQNFIKAKQDMADEVHGNTTLVEKRIVLLVDDKKSKLRDLFQKGREMVVAQDKYDKAVTEEKTAEFYLTNALLKRDAEKDLYLRRESGQSGRQPGEPGVPNPPGTGKKRRRRGERPQFGGAITSEQQYAAVYIASIKKNYLRLQHYINILSKLNLYEINPQLTRGNRNTVTTNMNILKRKIIVALRQAYDNVNYREPRVFPRFSYLLNGYSLTDDISRSVNIKDIASQQKAEKDAEAKRLAGIPAATATAAITARKAVSDARMADITNTATGIATATYDVAARTAAQAALEELRKLRGGGMRGGAKVKAMIEYELLVKEVEGAITAVNPDPVGYAATDRPSYIHPPALDKLNAFRTPAEKLNAYRALVQAVEKARRIDPENPILEAEILIERTAPTIVPISKEKPYVPAATAQQEVKVIADRIKPIYDAQEDPDKKAVLKLLMDSANFSVGAASQYKQLADNYNRTGKAREAQFQVKKIEEQEHRAKLRELLADLVVADGKQKYIDTLFDMRTEVTKNPGLYQYISQLAPPFSLDDQLYLELFLSTAEPGNTQYALERLDELIDQYSAVFPIVDRYRDTAAARISEAVPVVDETLKTGLKATGKAGLKLGKAGLKLGKIGAIAAGTGILAGVAGLTSRALTLAEITYQAASVLSTRDAILLAKVRAKRAADRAGEVYIDIRDRINQITGNAPHFPAEFGTYVIDIARESNRIYQTIEAIQVGNDDDKDTRVAKIQQAELLALQAEELSRQCIAAAYNILQREQEYLRRVQGEARSIQLAALSARGVQLAAQRLTDARQQRINSFVAELDRALQTYTTGKERLVELLTDIEEHAYIVNINKDLVISSGNKTDAIQYLQLAIASNNAIPTLVSEISTLNQTLIQTFRQDIFNKISEIIEIYRTENATPTEEFLQQLNLKSTGAEETQRDILSIDSQIAALISQIQISMNEAERVYSLKPGPPGGDPQPPNLKCSSIVRNWLDRVVRDKANITPDEVAFIISRGGVTRAEIEACVNYFNTLGEGIVLPPAPPGGPQPPPGGPQPPPGGPQPPPAPPRDLASEERERIKKLQDFLRAKAKKIGIMNTWADRLPDSPQKSEILEKLEEAKQTVFNLSRNIDNPEIRNPIVTSLIEQINEIDRLAAPLIPAPAPAPASEEESNEAFIEGMERLVAAQPPSDPLLGFGVSREEAAAAAERVQLQAAPPIPMRSAVQREEGSIPAQVPAPTVQTARPVSDILMRPASTESETDLIDARFKDIIESRQKESASRMKKPTPGLAARLAAERLAAKAEESRPSIASQYGSTSLLKGKAPVQGLPIAGNGLDLVDARYKGIVESQRRELQALTPEGIASLRAIPGRLSVQQLADERAKRAIRTAPPTPALPAPAAPSRLEAALAAARARRGAVGAPAAPNARYEEALAEARAKKEALGGGDRRKTLRYPIPSRRKTRRVW